MWGIAPRGERKLFYTPMFGSIVRKQSGKAGLFWSLALLFWQYAFHGAVVFFKGPLSRPWATPRDWESNTVLGLEREKGEILILNRFWHVF